MLLKSLLARQQDNKDEGRAGRGGKGGKKRRLGKGHGEYEGGQHARVQGGKSGG